MGSPVLRAAPTSVNAWRATAMVTLMIVIPTLDNALTADTTRRVPTASCARMVTMVMPELGPLMIASLALVHLQRHPISSAVRVTWTLTDR
ncbi:hypothetical protein DPMN_129154 [Dreissena polymorpha]|uniref:Uncharacterized protein n=1 Tax=Dreissena polymorpha TaxID=45954 RepID=A0A9D4JY09_DREPO|nr:hypothetical protein DPMN_129154 [Dreissena polymorpha]